MAVVKISLVLIPPVLDSDSYRKFHVLFKVLRIATFSSYSIFVQRNYMFKWKWMSDVSYSGVK